MLLAYFTYKNLSKCHRKVIPAFPYKQNQIIWESIHISGFPFLEVYAYFRYYPAVL